MRSRLPLIAAALVLLMPVVAEAKNTRTKEMKAAPRTASMGAQAAAMISAYRARSGLPPVRFDGSVQRAADFQARAMAQAGSMSHTVAGGLGSRIQAARIAIKSAATENIGAGQSSLAQVMGLWQASSKHSANMLNPAVTKIGIAVAHNPQSSYGNYWALVLTD